MLQVIDLIKNPTILAIDKVLRKRENKRDHRYVIELREGDNKITSFIIHGLPGLSDGYYELADEK